MEVKQVLIYGAGLMGRGIAQVFSRNPQYEVVLYDIADNQTMDRVAQELQSFVDQGILDQANADGQLGRIRFTTELTAELCQNTDLVVEAVFENMELKQEVFEKLEGLCRENTIFCTNTSVMSPTEIGVRIIHKERLVGTHFWNPATLIPLVEVVKAEHSADTVVSQVYEALKGVGKQPVICKRDVPGFIANRMQHALWREAIYIVEQGIADAETVDKAVKYSFGLRLPQLPPLVNADMVGTDLTYNIHEYILKHLCNAAEPSPLLTKLKEEGKLGFKTGEGFFSWNAETSKKESTALNEYLIHMLYKRDK